MNDKKSHKCNKKDIKHFFECCLTDEPAPIPEKIQILRQKIPGNEYPSVKYNKDNEFTVLPDMVVADLIVTFPHLKQHLSDLHPLGMMSPTLSQTSLEMLFADIEIDLTELCKELTLLINHKSPENEQ